MQKDYIYIIYIYVVNECILTRNADTRFTRDKKYYGELIEAISYHFRYVQRGGGIPPP